ncbi:hypothetical protein A5733_02895 [Mycobacterium sp. NS-7484]|uniref:phosphotransferase n=1 Tax=Mycobacterium sp. NS-7484 TaxID=1834161 RepID=UPI00097AEB5B|nr:phosphotransferase [Mycobacterium sp. NS-7484]OMC01739.1 hypothetical protein A5733_02895 [Mycobacterium sp. NS-7484]
MIAGSDVLAQIAQESALESYADKLPESQVAAELRHQYDLAGRLTRIPTEKDDTFRLATDVGKFLVKIAPASESARIVNLQSSAMLHLERSAAAVPAQRLIRGVQGQVESIIIDAHGKERILRVLTYLDGELLAGTVPTSSQLRCVGSMLARMDNALANFHHPEGARRLIWDLKNFLHMRPLLEFVNDRDDLTMATWVFDQFETYVAPKIGTLQSQIIHGDFSPFNVVVDPTSPDFVTGIIDFGDVVRSPVVFELAVAVANQIGIDQRHPWNSAVDIVRGYRSVRALSNADARLLAIAGPARLLLRALVFGWRAVSHPHTRDYGLSHSALDWNRLRCALSVSKATVEESLSTAGGKSPVEGKERQ